MQHILCNCILPRLFLCESEGETEPEFVTECLKNSDEKMCEKERYW